MDIASSKGFTLSASIDRFDGMSAILKLEGGQEIHWPVKLLPDDAHEGVTVRLTLSTAASDEVERAHVARAMLNDVLRVQE
jgi:hypothetical protein